MFIPQSTGIATEHKDLIHDVSYDYHGTRMATCSSDQTVKIWDKGDDGEWTCTASWKTHSGSVWRVTWALPEFGQVLATCSFDRTAAVWEEMIGEGRAEGRNRTWVKRTSLVDSRTSVTDVKFAPKHQGLQLATCSVDGIVRIYEAPDVMNLSQWSLQHEISSKLKCSCLSWNHSRRCPPMLAVGSDDPNTSAGGKVQIYEYNDGIRKWNKVETIAAVSDAVHDVAFAPNIGRSYHRLAIASKTLKIISLEPLRRDATLSGPTGLTKFELKQIADFNDHESQVWRVCWDLVGTILASSGDDNCVRLWKANYIGNWKCIAVKKGSGTQSDVSMRGDQMNNSTGSRESNKAQSNTRTTGNLNIRRNEGWPTLTLKRTRVKCMCFEHSLFKSIKYD